MSTPPRVIRRVSRPAPVASAAPPSPLPATKPVIPIKAYTPPADAADTSSAPRVDYGAVVERYKSKVDNRTSAIRAHCVECCCGVLSEVRNCAVTKCALYPFREGKDPFRKKRTDGFAAKNSETEGEEE